MLKPKKRWHIPEINADEIKNISNSIGIHPLIAQLLALRGLKHEDDISRFLHIDLSSLHDPFLLGGMKEAVKRIKEAIVNQEKILIYGDYDADGVSSTVLLYKTLKYLKADFAYYIPNRFTEGYGLNKEAIEQAAKKGFKLIITVDTGISAVEEAKLAKDLELCLIITDHHEPPAILPDAFAVINPKKPGDTYPFQYLAGVGVTLKLAQALLGRVPTELLDIAAIGTIADLVPLIDENRIIAGIGLKQMENTSHIGLRAILEETDLLDKELTAGHIGFVIAPRINASGRLDTASHAVRLLIANQPEEARELAKGLNQMNQERQSLVVQMTKEALDIIHSEQMEEDKVIVVAKEGWNEGVIGIVAARILEKYYRPTIVLSIDPETGLAKGSARSIEGYDIYQALTFVKEMLPHFGGHPAAAGLSMKAADIGRLRVKLNQLAEEWLADEDFIPIEKAEAVCSIHDIDIPFIQQIEQMAPFGIGNPIPKFLIDQIEVIDLIAVGKEQQHLKLNVEDQRKSMEALLFRQGELRKEIAHFSQIQLLGELNINEWNGQRKPQIIVKDLQIPSLQVFDYRNRQDQDTLKQICSGQTGLLYDESIGIDQHQLDDCFAVSYQDGILFENKDIKTLVILHLPPSINTMERILETLPELERIYCMYGNHHKTSAYTLDRSSFKRVYLALKKNDSLGSKSETERYLKTLGMDLEMIRFILDVFMELGFIIAEEDKIIINPRPEKKELHQSPLYREMMEQEKVKQLFLYAHHHKLKNWFLEQCSK